MSLFIVFHSVQQTVKLQPVSLSVGYQTKTYNQRKQNGNKHVTDLRYNMNCHWTNQIRSLIKSKKKIIYSLLRMKRTQKIQQEKFKNKIQQDPTIYQNFIISYLYEA